MFIPAIEEKNKREKEKIRKEIRLPLPDYAEDKERWEKKQEELQKEKEETVVHIQLI